jgi:preprotein translocase subunit SecF
MGIRAIHPVARLIAGSVTYILVVAFAIWMLGSEAWSLFVIVGFVTVATASPFIGAGAVWLIVRIANRRDDPQRRPHSRTSE